MRVRITAGALAGRCKSRAAAACGFGPGSSLNGLARIAGNTAASVRLDPGPNPRRIVARAFCSDLPLAFRTFATSPVSRGLVYRLGMQRLLSLFILLAIQPSLASAAEPATQPSSQLG